MNPLNRIIDEYAAFEISVGNRIKTLCGPYCSACTRICCRPEYCRENVDSPFLSALRRSVLPQTEYRAEQGWLTSNGCALLVGRPPVCYQFCCQKIVDAQPDAINRYVLDVLSNLIAHVGKNALRRRHLVEVMDAAKLYRIRLTGLKTRLNESRKAFHIIQSFYARGRLESFSLTALSKILPLNSSNHLSRLNDFLNFTNRMIHTDRKNKFRRLKNDRNL